MIKRIFSIVYLALSCIPCLLSQNNTSSPYTRYGYGDVIDAGFGQSKGMGGLSFGMRTSKFINTGNPASFSSIDSMTFRFEVGVAGKISTYSDKIANQTKFDANLEYLALQFPITKWLGFSAGILPSSFVGYDYYSKETSSSSILDGSVTSTTNYTGTGGIRQIYLGIGVNPFENLSIGASFEYSFGKIEHSSYVSFDTNVYSTMYQNKKIKINDANWNFGVQYVIPLKDEKKITLGAVLQPKSNLTSDANQEIISYGVDTVNIDDNGDFETALTIGFGATYNYSESLMFGFDYKRQNWSDVKYFGEKPFADRNRYAVGLEFHPNNMSKKYYDRMYYRFGANYSNSYVKINGETLDEFSLCAGLGFPLKKGLNPTIINFAFEYGNIGTTSNNLVKEQFFKLTLNATINERWFVKRKFE